MLVFGLYQLNRGSARATNSSGAGSGVRRTTQWQLFNDMLLKEPGKLSIVDLSDRAVMKKVPLGWNVSQIELSADRRHLMAYRPGPSASHKQMGIEKARLTIFGTKQSNIADVVFRKLSSATEATPDRSRR